MVGGMHGREGMHGRGVCMAGVCAWQGGVWHTRLPADTTRYGNTVNERAVRILLECILVFMKVYNNNLPDLEDEYLSIVRICFFSST